MSKKTTMTRSEKLANQIIAQILPEFSMAVADAVIAGRFHYGRMMYLRNNRVLSPILDRIIYPFHLDEIEHTDVERILREEAHKLLEEVGYRYEFCSEWNNERTPGHLDEIWLDRWDGNKYIFNNGELVGRW